jgi:predicted HTH domain antitoxin
MSLTITDEQLQTAGVTEREAVTELACRLFDIGKLTLPAAAKFAGLSRVEMESELLARNIPIYRPTIDEVREEVETLKRLGF